DPVLQPEASSPGAKDENTGAGLCRSRLVVQERLGHYRYAKSAAIVYKESRKEEYLNDSVQFMNRSLAQITGENMIGANGRSVPEMALPESYNYIHKSGTLHEAPSPIIPLNWSKASMTLMLKEMSNLINDEGIK
ncbi:hypothetical protein ACTQZC_22870, partial [Escherichia coli]